MKANDYLLWLAGILAYAAWGALVLLGKTPVDPFVVAIASAATGMGTHALKSNSISPDKILEIVNQVVAALPQPAPAKAAITNLTSAAPAPAKPAVATASAAAPAAPAQAAAPLQ